MKNIRDRTLVKAGDLVNLFSTMNGTKRVPIPEAWEEVACVAVIQTSLPRGSAYTLCGARSKRRVSGLQAFSQKVRNPSREQEFPLCLRHARASMIRIEKTRIER